MVTAVVISLESVIRDYILNCTVEGKSPKTISDYQSVLRNFLWYCRNNKFPELSEITTTHIRQFLFYLRSETNRWGMNSPGVRKPASQTTANDYYRALHSFFNWLVREELISENPFINLKAPKVEKKVIQALTESEIESLLSLCSKKTALDIRNKAILSVLFDCGLRVSELASITIRDIDWESRSILIRKGKGGKQRMVSMGSRTYKALWKYVNSYRNGESDRVFINRNGEQLDTVGIQILIKRLGQKAKIRVSPHKLRHTFAITYLRNGGDVFTLQYLLGHSTLQMTQRYLQSLNAADAANAHRKYSPMVLSISEMGHSLNRRFLYNQVALTSSLRPGCSLCDG